MYWEVTLHDIKSKVKLFVGQKQAHIVQDFQTLNKVTALLFGSEKKDEKPPEIQTKQELKAKFSNVFGSM